MNTLIRLRVLFVFALLSFRAFSQTPSSVDIRMIRSSVAGSLEVQVRSNGSGFQGIVSALVFTLRWPATSQATLGTRVEACHNGIPLSYTGQISDPFLNGNPTGFNYMTYSCFGTDQLGTEGCPLPQDTWFTVMTVPVTGDAGCTAFRIVNDAYTTASNKNFFCSLNGNNLTGSIAAGSASICKVDLTLTTSSTPGVGLDVKVRVNGGPFQEVFTALTFTIRWSTTSPATLGTCINSCPAGIPVSQSAILVNPSLGGNPTGFNYRHYAAFGASNLSAEGCPIPQNTWLTVTTVPVTGDVSCTAFSIVNDAYTTANNMNYYCSLNGEELTGAIVANQIWFCGTDCQGGANGPAVPGSACSDGNPCTVNEVWSATCVCQGTLPDTDGDGTCDALDGCPSDPNKIAPGTCGCGAQEPGASCNDGNSTTYNDVVNAGCMCVGSPGCLLSTKVFLEGPYDPGNGKMNDNLRAMGLVPFTEPYTSLGYSFVQGGGETVSAGVLSNGNTNLAKVDWLIIELRSATNPATVVASRAAPLCRNGTVTELDGNNGTIMLRAPPATQYHVAIRHRNHLGVMTAGPVLFVANQVTTVDFTAAGLATYGTSARKSITGANPALALWAGDANWDGQLKYTGPANDRDPILVTVGSASPNNTAFGYNPRDVNMDGTTKYTGGTNDRDPILVNVGSTTPNNVRSAQLP